MKEYLLSICFSFIVGSSIGQDTLPSISVKMGSVEYEKVFTVDSAKSKEQLFNAVKQALIRNTNYKFQKVDEDRIVLPTVGVEYLA